jgi:hypothetical protein
LYVGIIVSHPPSAGATRTAVFSSCRKISEKAAALRPDNSYHMNLIHIITTSANAVTSSLAVVGQQRLKRRMIESKLQAWPIHRHLGHEDHGPSEMCAFNSV